MEQYLKWTIVIALSFIVAVPFWYVLKTMSLFPRKSFLLEVVASRLSSFEWIQIEVRRDRDSLVTGLRLKLKRKLDDFVQVFSESLTQIGLTVDKPVYFKDGLDIDIIDSDGEQLYICEIYRSEEDCFDLFL